MFGARDWSKRISSADHFHNSVESGRKSSGSIGRPEGILMRTGWPPLWFANAQNKSASTSGATQRRLASDPLVLQRYVRCSSQAKRTKRFWQLIIAYDGHWHQTCGTFGDCVLKMRKLNELLLICLATLSYATPVDLVDTLNMSRHLWPYQLGHSRPS